MPAYDTIISAIQFLRLTKLSPDAVNLLCWRCGSGVDNDRDGNCSTCDGFTLPEATEMKLNTLSMAVGMQQLALRQAIAIRCVGYHRAMGDPEYCDYGILNKLNQGQGDPI